MYARVADMDSHIQYLSYECYSINKTLRSNNKYIQTIDRHTVTAALKVNNKLHQ